MASSLRAELQAIVDGLLERSADTLQVHLDAIGEAIGARAVTAPEIEAIIAALESSGRTLIGPSGGEGETRLKTVITTARTLGPQLGRRPTVAEIATASGLSDNEVRHALLLVRIMQR